MKLTFRNRIRNWFKDYDVDHTIDDSKLESEDTINFSIIPAKGGRIVQVYYFDSRKDKHIQSLHVITPDEDLAVALAHILTIETLGK